MEKYQISTTADMGQALNSLDTVKSVPVFYGGNKTKTEDYQGIYNTNTGEIAQIASKHYAIIQHRDVVASVIEELKAKGIEVSGRLDNFRNQIRMDLVFKNKGAPVKDGEKGVQIGIRVLNSYNKSASFRMEMYGYRLICQNGMSLGHAMNGIKEITYHMGAEKTLNQIRAIVKRFVDNVISSSSVLQDMVNTSIKDTVQWKECAKILENLLQHKKHRNKICEILGISVIEVYDKKTKKRTFNYVLEKEGKEKITRWDFYNAITNYASHNELGLSVENTVQEAAQKVLKNKYEKLIEIEA